jgi:3-hydroxyacyl-[acyl-carrier-protein] dehydratase
LVVITDNQVRVLSNFISGDQLHIKAEVMTVKRGIWKFKCSATVDEKIVTRKGSGVVSNS